jgi:hypothetical protein
MTALTEGLRAEALTPVTDPGVQALVAAIQARSEAPVRAVLFYGSGLWQGVTPDKVQDFYALTDRQRDFDRRTVVAALGRLLPPNVYYLETDAPDAAPESMEEAPRLRAKCAVMRWDQFAAAARGRAATPHIWARFAQPCRIVYTEGAATREALLGILGDAVITFHRKIRPLAPPGADARHFWLSGLMETYARELRSESPDRAAAVFDADPERLAWRSEVALPMLAGVKDGTPVEAIPPVGPGTRLRARALSALARPLGKAVTLLRLMKATLTFEGGVDYVLWKIERHSGVKETPSDFARRHPLIGGWPILIRLYRRGAFR